MRWSASFLFLYLIPKSSTTSARFISMYWYVQSPRVIFLVRSCKFLGVPWVLYALWSLIAPGHTLPFPLWHIYIYCFACLSINICPRYLGEWVWALSCNIRLSSLDFSCRCSLDLQWYKSYLVLRRRCSNGVWPWLNLLWGWRMDLCMKFFRLPLWVTLCGFFSSWVWCCILSSCMWPCCIGEPRSCGWRNIFLFPRYLWFLGIGVLSRFLFPLSILVCPDPSSGVCTLGISILW